MIIMMVFNTSASYFPLKFISLLILIIDIFKFLISVFSQSKKGYWDWGSYLEHFLVGQFYTKTQFASNLEHFP